VLNFNNCVGKRTDVTQYPQGQSYYKALDMEGNTFEWVADWYNALYYPNSPPQDPSGPDTGLQRSVRSSSYRSKPEQTPAPTRFFELPQNHRSDLGFRCVVEDPAYYAPACQTIGLFAANPSAGVSGGQVLVDCPKVNITLAPACHRGVVDVTITDDHPNDPNAVVGGLSSCPMISGSPGSFPQTYECSSSTTAHIQSICTYTISGPVKCGLHYTLNTSSGMCEWDGTGATGNQCPPNGAYDPVNKCCTAQPGNSVSVPACPSGTSLGFYTPLHTSFKVPVCVPNNLAHNQPKHDELVTPPNPATCTVGHGTCPTGQTYTCMPNPGCIYYGGPCYLPPVCSCQ
jgi:hypothetical protein